MSSNRIVCTDQEPVHRPTTHAHIVAVGIGSDPNKADRRMTLEEVLVAMRQGDSFHTIGAQSGKLAQVQAVACPHGCGHAIIKTVGDHTTDNNLDSLRQCNWSSS